MGETIKKREEESRIGLSLKLAKEFLHNTLSPTIISTHIQGKPTKSSLAWAHFLEACSFINNKDERVTSKIFHTTNYSFSLDEKNNPSTMCTSLCGIICIDNNDIKSANSMFESLKSTYVLNNVYEFVPDQYVQVRGEDPPLAMPSTCGRMVVFLCRLFKKTNNEEAIELAKDVSKFMTKDELKTFDQWVIRAILELSPFYKNESLLKIIDKNLDKYRKLQIIALPSYVAGHFAQAYIGYREILLKYNINVPEWIEENIEKTINHLLRMQILPSSRTMWPDAYNGAFIKSVGKTDEIHTISSIMAIGALDEYEKYKI